MTEDFDVKLVEDVKYYTPDPQYKKNAWMGDYQKAYDEFLADPDAFWSKMAKELEWIKPWDAVREWNYPYAKWFTNAKLNITANCLDRHVNNQRRNKVALIWRGEEGRERIFTYQKLLSQVNALCKCVKENRREKRRLCLYLHAACSRAGHRNACLCTDRCNSQRGIWRIWCCSTEHADPGCRGKGRHHRRCCNPPRESNSAQSNC